MKHCTYTQFKNQFRDVSVHVKQVTGKPGDNQRLEEEAAVEIIAGNSQERFEQFKKALSGL